MWYFAFDHVQEIVFSIVCFSLLDVQRIFINPPQFVFKEYGGLTSLVDLLDIHLYLYIILVLGNCGSLRVWQIKQWEINKN